MKNNYMNKITLVRTTDPESRLCSKLLRENQIEFIEVHSDSDSKPFLLIKDKAFSCKGLPQIRSYVNGLKNYSEK